MTFCSRGVSLARSRVNQSRPTQVPQHSAAVLDSKIAVNIFRRWGFEIMANPYADSAFEYNQIHYRAETRFALGVIYPEAICLVDLTDSAS